MKKYISHICLFLFFLHIDFSSALAQYDSYNKSGMESGKIYHKDEYGNVKEINAALIHFDKYEHDFGNMILFKTYQTDFFFTNTGNIPLIIQQVRTSCDCTTTIFTRSPIMPGERGVITVYYDTKDRVGKFHKSLTIMANTPDDFHRLYIKGIVTDRFMEEKPEVVNKTETETEAGKTTTQKEVIFYRPTKRKEPEAETKPAYKSQGYTPKRGNKNSKKIFFFLPSV